MGKTTIIGIAGGSGSGKTSVTSEIMKNLDGYSVALIEQDYYYKDQSHMSFEDRLKTNYDHPFAFDNGIFALENEDLRNLMDVKIYVDTDADLRILRRLTRDIKERGRTMESVIDQYLSVVRPMHIQFIEPTKKYADIIIPEGGSNKVAIDIMTTKIQSLVKNI